MGLTDSVSRTTEEAIMVSQKNERVERDLTFYFILAAFLGLLAFLLAILIILRVKWASKKKYAVKRSQYEHDYLGSKPSKS